MLYGASEARLAAPACGVREQVGQHTRVLRSHLLIWVTLIEDLKVNLAQQPDQGLLPCGSRLQSPVCWEGRPLYRHSMQPAMVRRLSWGARWSGRAARAAAARPLHAVLRPGRAEPAS